MVYTYKRKEPVISAIQYTGDNKNEIIEFCNKYGWRTFEDPNSKDILYTIKSYNDKQTDSVLQIKVGCFVISENDRDDAFMSVWEEDSFDMSFYKA